ILEYLNELFPEKQLWPADFEARAFARCVATEMHSGFREVRYSWPMNLRRVPAHRPLNAEGEAQRERIEELWDTCRARFGAGGLRGAPPGEPLRARRGIAGRRQRQLAQEGVVIRAALRRRAELVRSRQAGQHPAFDDQPDRADERNEVDQEPPAGLAAVVETPG